MNNIKWTPAPPRYKYQNSDPPYKRVCFGMGGQYGDVLMQEPALRKFIKDNPDTKITLAICDKFKEVLPLFYNYHDNIVEYKIWEGYDNWPSPADIEYIEQQQFDAMFPCQKPFHEDNGFANYRHIVTETALMLGVTADDTKINLRLPKEVKKEPKTASIHMFSSKWPNGLRSIDLQKQELIVKYLMEKGYKVYQISSPSQPHIENTIKPVGTYYDACINALNTDFLISCDSGMLWVSSAYDLPTLGLFSFGYNPLVRTTKNWQPVNPNAIYLESLVASDIPLFKIFNAIDKLIELTS